MHQGGQQAAAEAAGQADPAELAGQAYPAEAAGQANPPAGQANPPAPAGPATSAGPAVRTGADGLVRMLELDHLRRRYGDVVALDGLTFTVPPGQVFGFLGPERCRARPPPCGPSSASSPWTAARCAGAAQPIDAAGAPPDRLHAGRARPLPRHDGARAARVPGPPARDDGRPGPRAAAALDRAPGRGRQGSDQDRDAVPGQPAAGAAGRRAGARTRAAGPRRAVLRARPGWRRRYERGTRRAGRGRRHDALLEPPARPGASTFATAVAIIHRGRLVAEGSVEELRRRRRSRGSPSGWPATTTGALGRTIWAARPGWTSSHGRAWCSCRCAERADAQAVLDGARAAGPVEHFTFERQATVRGIPRGRGRPRGRRGRAARDERASQREHEASGREWLAPGANPGWSRRRAGPGRSRAVASASSPCCWCGRGGGRPSSRRCCKASRATARRSASSAARPPPLTRPSGTAGTHRRQRRAAVVPLPEPGRSQAPGCAAGDVAAVLVGDSEVLVKQQPVRGQLVAESRACRCPVAQIGGLQRLYARAAAGGRAPAREERDRAAGARPDPAAHAAWPAGSPGWPSPS